MKPTELGLYKTLEMVGASKETFFYRQMHKRIIEVGFIDKQWFNVERGPSIYAVTDHHGTIRYVGKHEGSGPLRSRWLRRGYIHHQHSSREKYIAELDASRAPLTLWSCPVARLLRLPAAARALPAARLAVELEALWIRRLRPQLTWNAQWPAGSPDFDDGIDWSAFAALP